ncbi:MAG: molecular chaperone TorD family protein [Coriobacteriales bacterium]|nr:molecular chaperone TorD family protein [Coriobacteriales bacterium]
MNTAKDCDDKNDCSAGATEFSELAGATVFSEAAGATVFSEPAGATELAELTEFSETTEFAGAKEFSDLTDCAAFRDVLEERQLAYSFLATAFRQEVTSEFLTILRDGQSDGYRNEHQGGHCDEHQVDVADNKQVLEGLNSTLSGTMAEFVDSLHALDDNAINKVRTDLAAEYSRLFLAMSAHPVPPYESVYTSEKRLLMQEAWKEVVSEYNSIGFKKHASFSLPDDHIALELEFMSVLIAKSIISLDANDIQALVKLLQRQHTFFFSHLNNWVLTFCNDLQKTTTSLFYRGLAELTKEMICSELDFFKPQPENI